MAWRPSARLEPPGGMHALFEDARVLGAPGVDGAEEASQKLMAELKNTRLAMTGRFACVSSTYGSRRRHFQDRVFPV